MADNPRRWFVTGFVAILFVGLFSGCPKPPLTPEKPAGPAIGYKNVVLACTTQTTDPAGGQVAYQFDWGDGTRSEWSGWVDGGVAFADTHTYTTSGTMEVRARAKNTRGRVSGWSEPLVIEVSPGEGEVRWRFGLPDPESPEDSADFSAAIFSIGPEGQIYIPAADVPALLCRNQQGARRWEFFSPEEDDFGFGATIADDGTVYIGTETGTLFALTPSGTTKWSATFSSGIFALPALGLDGTIYIQTENDTFFALDLQNGARKWSFYRGGGERCPVVGTDGTVFVSQDDSLYALDPADGSVKWAYGMRQAIVGSPAIDVARGVLYVVDDDGWLACVNLSDGAQRWSVQVGNEVSAGVIDEDGTVYLTSNGTLIAVNPEQGNIEWQFVPPLSGDASVPAVSAEGVIYFLVIGLFDQGQVDSLYAVNRDGTRRWAVGLGVGLPGDFISAPKIDDVGYVYVGNGTRAWCIVGRGGPAQSSWPMFGGDIRNSGRAR